MAPFKTLAYFDRVRAIRYRYIHGSQFYVTLPKRKGRTRAFAMYGHDAWFEVPLADALITIAKSKMYDHDDRHPLVKAFCEYFGAQESAQEPLTDSNYTRGIGVAS